MPKFLAPIQMCGNNIDLGGGEILNAKNLQLDAVLAKLDEIALAINALKPKRVVAKKKTTVKSRVKAKPAKAVKKAKVKRPRV